MDSLEAEKTTQEILQVIPIQQPVSFRMGVAEYDIFTTLDMVSPVEAHVGLISRFLPELSLKSYLMRTPFQSDLCFGFPENFESDF